jgi:hypothetical protein
MILLNHHVRIQKPVLLDPLNTTNPRFRNGDKSRLTVMAFILNYFWMCLFCRGMPAANC